MNVSFLSAGPAGIIRHCPQCGRADPAIEEGRSIRCPDCGFHLFFNSAASAGALILREGRLLVCVRAKEPAKGLLGVPGGFIEYGETVEEGLRREVWEELHIEVENFRYLCSSPNDYLYAGVPYKTTDMYFLCEVADLSGIRAADDVGDYLWVEPRALDPNRLAFTSARRALAVLLDKLEDGNP